MNTDLVSGSHAVGQSLYHLEFCPKFRYNALRSEHVKTFLKEVLMEIAGKYGMKIHAMGLMPDHVHLFVDIPPTLSVSQAFQYFKGISAHEIFQKFPGFKMRYPGGNFWSPGKFYRSVGSVTAEVVKHYVEHQQEDELKIKFDKQPTLLDFS